MSSQHAGELGTQITPGDRLSAAGAEALAALRRNGRAIGAWTLAFVLVLMLAFENGGYEIAIRSEVGIAVWWIVLVGAAAGMLRFGAIGRTGWLAIACLGALALWTGLGIGWSESAERSAGELARVATYLGILVLALSLQGREGLRVAVSAVAAAIAVVGVAALLSRFEPGWLGDGIDTSVLGGGNFRLNYPLNYWNGLATLMAIGIPLALTMALRARSLAVQAVAAACVPALALTAFYTYSRGGAAEIGIALVVLLALLPRRLAAASTLLTCGAGSAIVIAAATQRDALEAGLAGAATERQGDEMLALVCVVCAGVALLQVAIGLVRRYGLGPRIRVPRQVTAAVGIATALLAVGAALGPADLGQRWEDFKDPGRTEGVGAARFESTSGSGRYQLWDAAVTASKGDELTGIGPGTYEFWWARNGELSGFVRDAHSLYLETLAELGLPGFVLVITLIGGTLVVGVRRVLQTSEDKRALLAGALAACSAFAAAAAVDWAWELAVLPAAFLILAAAITGPQVIRRQSSRRRRSSSRHRRTPRGEDGVGLRLAVVGGALVALLAIVIPYAAADAVGESQDDAGSAKLGPALERADRAAAIQPYAATPELQRALVLERQGNLAAAAAAARDATDEESTNWRTWLTLSAIEARRGNAQPALDAYLEAYSLNPRSVIFKRLR